MRLCGLLLALPWAAVSKSEQRPDFGTKTGRIMLQDYESKVWYRNLVINEL